MQVANWNESCGAHGNFSLALAVRMPEFWCLQCDSCQYFQEKASKKFQCLMCGAKQSVQEDIRMMVQELNLRRQRTDEDTVDDALGSEEIEVNTEGLADSGSIPEWPATVHV
ncbi:hypothetical protein WJX84_009258 [Apatococcus fuscideae]|uniref:MRN complex-interacting protein N-terminal domain-containing protein n=1 Tax=Apatococcus fuscideae TaxID=2026836 RepID=A0AAW1SUX7_9CHLO